MVLMGKPSINDGSSIATFDETRGPNLPKTIDKTGHRLRLVGITHRETKELDDPSLFPCKFAIAIGAYPWTKAIQPSSHTVGHPVIFP